VVPNVEVHDRATGTWRPTDPERLCTGATNAFTAFGRGLASRPIRVCAGTGDRPR